MKNKFLILTAFLVTTNLFTGWKLIFSDNDRNYDIVSVANAESSQIILGDTLHLQLSYFKYRTDEMPIVTILSDNEYKIIDSIDYEKGPNLYYDIIPKEAGTFDLEAYIFIDKIDKKRPFPINYQYVVSKK